MDDGVWDFLAEHSPDEALAHVQARDGLGALAEEDGLLDGDQLGLVPDGGEQDALEQAPVVGPRPRPGAEPQCGNMFRIDDASASDPDDRPVEPDVDPEEDLFARHFDSNLGEG